MARSSRLSVCLAIVMRNSSKIHCARSISRQRTTPWTAGIGPLSIMRASVALGVVELGRLSRRLAVQETIRPTRVELQHPIPNDLKRHPADLRRLGAPRAVVNRRKSQKPTGLRPILRLLRQTTQPRRVEISSQGIGAAMTNLHRSPC